MLLKTSAAWCTSLITAAPDAGAKLKTFPSRRLSQTSPHSICDDYEQFMNYYGKRTVKKQMSQVNTVRGRPNPRDDQRRSRHRGPTLRRVIRVALIVCRPL